MSDALRRVGRPPNPEPNEVLHIRVTVATYDRLCKLAFKAGKPVSVAARIMLERDLKRMEALMEL
jgi:predicted DNA-binding protein